MNKYLSLFFERNKDYIKHSDVTQELIQKYTGILPDAILEVWRRTGFGIYEHGFIQFVNPEEYAFVLDYIDVIYDPVVVFGITALGDVLSWYGGNCSLGGNSGNHINITFVNDCDDEVLSGSNIGFWLGDNDVNIQDTSHINFNYMVKEYRSVNYHKIKNILPALKYGQCYGYVPIPALGGKKSYKNLQVVDAKTYIDIIGQAVGKIIDLEG